jgi:hypothetical protein
MFQDLNGVPEVGSGVVAASGSLSADVLSSFHILLEGSAEVDVSVGLLVDASVSLAAFASSS